MLKPYTGIGARDTPDFILKDMERIGRALASQGFELRSGNAEGADQAFARGANGLAPALVTLYLPWYSFHQEAIHPENTVYTHPAPWTESIARKSSAELGRNWPSSQGQQKLLSRNVHQIMGVNQGDGDSLFVICWTRGASMVGGTSYALQLAIKRNVKIHNLADRATREAVMNRVREIEG